MSFDQNAGMHFDSPSSIDSPACNVEDHGPNNHLTLIYESRAEQFATAIPFVQRGIERGDHCIYVADDNDEETVKRAMREAGIDVESAVEAGLLSLQRAADLYLGDDEFDPEEMIDSLDEMVEEAVNERGHDHVRITSEMTWVLNGEEHFDALAEYEKNLNHFYPDKAVTGLCQYNRERFPARILHDVIRTHPQVVYEDTLSQNFFYRPPAKFFEEDFEMEIDQRVETVLRQARVSHSLAEHERGLSALTDASRGLVGETPDDVRTYAVRNVQTILDTRHAAICEYDGAESRLLSCTTAHAGDEFDPDRYHDRLWEVFVTNESAVMDELPSTDDGSAVRSLLAVPLGRHGVLVAASPDADAFDASDVDFAETVGANVQAALDRADREAVLDEREQTLARQNDLIDRLERVSELLRDISQVLVGAPTKDDIKEAVCDRLARSGAYEFVWFGDYDVATDGLEPSRSAGVSRDYVDAVELRADGSAFAEPSVRTAETEQMHVVQDVLARTPVEAWQREAFERGFRSVAAVPVAYEGVLYGVVSVYADETDAFDDLERTVLSELGETIGFAINALERKQALVDDRVVELELEIADPAFEAVDFARQTGGTYDFHGVVPNDDGFRVFAAVQNCTADEVYAYAEESMVVGSPNVVAERDDGLLAEYTLRESGLIPKLLAHGGKPVRITADESGAEVVVSLPSSADASAFVEMLRGHYSGVELVAKRTRQRGYETTAQFHSELEGVLTPRQHEALQTAYYSGFFDWPRASTGEEIAERMGISQPTFNRHLREGSRKLFWKLFEDDAE